MKANNWLTAIIVMIVGILLIVWHKEANLLDWFIVAVGVMFIIPGLYSLISALVRKGNREKEKVDHSAATSTIIASVGALALGIWMAVSPGFFVGLLAYIFGGILILYGIFHIIFVGFWSRPYVLPGWFYIIPVLMIIAGVVIICTNVRTMNSIVSLITGISLVASSVSTILEISAVNPAGKREELPAE
ncbi:MAG: DUF308 domain-containing protein [Paramuribaculum sp.]|nr:DUF308 domain-containing protein [Paramuribaculum sp.]